MLTDYMVICPKDGCHWSGSLLPSGNRDAWLPALPSAHVVTFCCPRCHAEWRAHLVGDDVKPLPERELATTDV
jgi:hypothetical protein